MTRCDTRPIRILLASFALAILSSRALHAQQSPPADPNASGAQGQPAASQQTAPAPPPTNLPPAKPPESDELSKWTVSASAYTVNPPEDDAYTSATLRLDRDALHVEGRWNYEAKHTGSAWLGWNFDLSPDEKHDLDLHVTPMAGAVFGDVDGVAPGLLFDGRWKWLGLYNESEYVFGTHDSNDDFFYSWTELTLAPVEWLKFGLVAQRTKAYDTNSTIDRGPMLSVTFKRVSATIYWFDPDRDHSYVMFAIGFGF